MNQVFKFAAGLETMHTCEVDNNISCKAKRGYSVMSNIFKTPLVYFESVLFY